MLILVAVGAIAAPADGAYLSYRAFEGAPDDGLWIYAAADGEANELTVTEVGRELIFHDRGAPIQVLSIALAPSRCPGASDSDEGEVRCTLRSLPANAQELIGVDLSDGDDTGVVSTSRDLSLDGGPGDDAVTALRPALLSGGTGRDHLTGSPQDDRLEGGDEADTIDGGGGRDTVSYFSHRGLVTVDLRRHGPQGTGADGDTLVNIENVAAGFGASRLIGDSWDNWLFGGAQRDILIGGPGADRLDGSHGNDSLYGGSGKDVLIGDSGAVIGKGPAAGKDYLSAVDGERDVVNCGPGRDTARADRLDRLIGCERVILVR